MKSTPTPLSRSGAEAKIVVVAVNSTIYSRQVVLRALHSLVPRIVGQVSAAPGEDNLTVQLSSVSGDLVEEADIRNRLLIALGDFVLRERLEAETLPSRHLIIQQAFERNNLQIPELDTALPGLDPLGLSEPDLETGRKHDAAD